MPTARCPVCQTACTEALCPACGFDRSCDYERYPSLGRIPGGRYPSVSARRTVREAQDRPPEEPQPQKAAPTEASEEAPAESIEALYKAAFMGDADAQKQLGEYYLKSGEYALATDLLQKAARQKNADACYLLGGCYLRGLGVNPSDSKAVAWLNKASSLGNIQAKLNLAECCLNGRGTKKDLQRAEALYLEAAKYGYTDGLYRLAQFYLHDAAGFGGDPSREKAKKLLLSARQYGNPNADALLETLRAQEISAGPQSGTTPEPTPARQQEASAAGKRSTTPGKPDAKTVAPQRGSRAQKGAKPSLVAKSRLNLCLRMFFDILLFLFSALCVLAGVNNLFSGSDSLIECAFAFAFVIPLFISLRRICSLLSALRAKRRGA